MFPASGGGGGKEKSGRERHFPPAMERKVHLCNQIESIQDTDAQSWTYHSGQENVVCCRNFKPIIRKGDEMMR